jgi:predicted AAA+ superfamily ATPase
VFRDYVTEPERLERELAAAESSLRTVFIDEVQRVPALLDAVQAAIDAQPRRFLFLLSVSSARKLRRGQANLLAGRIHLHYLHPLIASELGAEFNLERALAHGTLPGIYAEKDADLRSQDLRGYVDAYLREEIQAEALVRDLGGYARLLDLAAASSGRILNVNALCRDAGISYETARRYVQILEDTLVAYRIPAWSGSDRASLISHAKMFLFDMGVRNALLRRPLHRCLDDERGLLLEHLVANELHARTGTLWPELRVSHFRTRHGAEIDFVLEVGRDVWAIEVKASRRLRSPPTSGFASLAQRSVRLKRKIVVFLGARKQSINDVEVLPIEDFLGELPR